LQASVATCVPTLASNENYAIVGTLVGVAFLIQMFDIYLDTLRLATYKIKQLPPSFKEGYKLSDAIDQRLGKGDYEIKEDNPVPKMPINLSDVTDTPSKVSQLMEPLRRSITLTDLKKIEDDFLLGQEYNYRHVKVTILYKAVLAVFWVVFWVDNWLESLYQLNLYFLFPNAPVSGCPMQPFWADFCVGLMIELELTLLHALFFTAMLWYDCFVIQKKYGFLKQTLCPFLLR
jgi:hypothetical protein